MTKTLKINTSIKYQSLIGITSGLWLFLFLFLIKPFKQDKLPVTELIQIGIGMALIIAISYFIIIIIQNKVYKFFNIWNRKFEVLTLLSFSTLSLIGCYIFYKSTIVNGSYTLLKFFIRDYLPTLIILLPFVIFSRNYILRYLVNEESKEKFITITGENKLDYLKIESNKLICVSSAQNYVELHYLKNEILSKKLIRKSLKKIEIEFPFLIKVHRSHLINPLHLVSYKDKKTLQLTKIEIPFSDNYKNNIHSK